MYIHVYTYMDVYIEREMYNIHTYTYINIYIYICIYLFYLHMCVGYPCHMEVYIRSSDLNLTG